MGAAVGLRTVILSTELKEKREKKKVERKEKR